MFSGGDVYYGPVVDGKQHGVGTLVKHKRRGGGSRRGRWEEGVHKGWEPDSATGEATRAFVSLYSDPDAPSALAIMVARRLPELPPAVDRRDPEVKVRGSGDGGMRRRASARGGSLTRRRRAIVCLYSKPDAPSSGNASCLTPGIHALRCPGDRGEAAGDAGVRGGPGLARGGGGGVGRPVRALLGSGGQAEEAARALCTRPGAARGGVRPDSGGDGRLRPRGCGGGGAGGRGGEVLGQVGGACTREPL